MVKVRVAAAALSGIVMAIGIAQGAPIEVTGGTLTATASVLGYPTSQTTTISATPDSFQASASRVENTYNPGAPGGSSPQVVSSGSMSVNNAGGALAVNGSVFGDYFFPPPGSYDLPASAWASGTIDFTLAEATQFQISWLRSFDDPGLNWNDSISGGSLSLSMGTTTLLYCGFSGTGCNSSFAGGPQVSSILLSAGTYRAQSALTARPLSSRANYSFQFGLAPAPVPLPLGAWLFVSGLMGLVGFAKRRATTR